MPPKQGKPKNVVAPTENLSQADKKKEQGNKALQNQNYEQAITLYTEAIELDSTKAPYFSNRAYCYYLVEKYNESLQDAQQCIELDPNFFRGYIRLGNALLELDQAREAKAAFQKAKQLGEDQDIQQGLLNVEQQIIQDSVLPEEDPEVVKQQQMLDWMKLGSSQFDQLKMRWYAQNYRGVHASKKIYNQQVILFVPQSHLITLEMGQDTSVGKKIIQHKLDLLSPKHTFLSSYLLQEKQQNDSFWKPYIDILPSDYNSFPIFFSESELEWLKGSPFLNQVKEKISDIKKDYDDVCAVAPEFRQYTFDQFKWARMSASSRIFGLQIDNVKTDAFVPLADMLNHKRPKQTSWSYCDERKGFIIEAQEDIPRGDQVYDSYGRKCNSRFLLNYGFILLDNDANEVAVQVSFDEDDPTLKQKIEMMGEHPQEQTFRILSSYTEQNTTEFFSYIRFVLLKDRAQLLMLNNLHESAGDDSQDDRLTRGYKPTQTPPISMENEIQMWERIEFLCDRNYQQYTTTYEEDLELLKKDTLTNNQRNCVLLRSGEKEILQYFLEMSQKMRTLLSMPQKEIPKNVTKKEYSSYSEYVNRLITSIR